MKIKGSEKIMQQQSFRVFISHSAHATEEPLTQAFLDALIEAIKAENGFEPLVDQITLTAGDDWMQQIYAWLGLCDAAVLLLSPHAVTRGDSVWVPREANLLLWRRSLDPDFIIIPAFLGGLEAKDLKSNKFLADLRLEEIQFARSIADDEKIKNIVHSLRNKLAVQATKKVFEPLQVHIEDCLQRFAPINSIDRTLEEHFAGNRWQPLVPNHQKLALHMVRSAATECVDLAIETVIIGSQEQYKLGSKLFDSLFPIRLPADVSCQLLHLCKKLTGRGCVVISAVDKWVLEVLFRSATGLSPGDLQKYWEIIELIDDWGDDDLTEATRQLAMALADTMLWTNAWEELSDNAEPEARFSEQMFELNRQLEKARKERGAPVVICVAYRPRWLELAAELVKRFPTTVFVLRTADALPLIAANTGNCELLESPLWPPGCTREMRTTYRRKIKRFGGNPT